MKTRVAQPNGTAGKAVGDSNPGMRPIRLQNKMNSASATRNGVNRSLWCPMISSLCPWIKPWRPSKVCPRPLHGEARPCYGKYRRQKCEDQKLHGHAIGNRRLRRVRLDVERPQQFRDWASQQVVQNRCEPELFGHKKAISAQPSALSFSEIKGPSPARYKPQAASHAIPATVINRPANSP